MDKNDILELHQRLLTCWNGQDAKGMASLFSDDGTTVGFDGSQLSGKDAIEMEMQKIFSHHQTARFVWKVKEVLFLKEDVALLRAVAGMVPPRKTAIVPERNAIQSLIAVNEENKWKIVLFQNTPAQFHGRPELAEALTKELNEVLE